LPALQQANGALCAKIKKLVEMTKPRLNQLFIWKGFIYLATEQDRPQRRSLCALRSYAADYNSRCGSSLILMLWRLAFYRLGPDDIVVYDGDARGAAVVARGGARYSFELAVEGSLASEATLHGYLKRGLFRVLE